MDRLLQFISLRLFPAKPEEFPPMVKCTWWIPSATKVLSLFSRYFLELCTYASACVYTYRVEIAYTSPSLGETGSDGGTV